MNLMQLIGLLIMGLGFILIMMDLYKSWKKDKRLKRKDKMSLGFIVIIVGLLMIFMMNQ